QHPLEEGLHAAGVEGGAIEERQAHAVGLALVLAGVVDLLLDLQRARAYHRGFRGLAAGARGEDGEGEGGERGPLRARVSSPVCTPMCPPTSAKALMVSSWTMKNVMSRGGFSATESSFCPTLVM